MKRGNGFLTGLFDINSSSCVLSGVFWLILLILCLTGASVFAGSAPVVSNVRANQRADDSKLIDIYYNLSDADGDTCTVWCVVSDNGGLTWSVPAITFTGHIGKNITPGTNKHIIWDAGKDMPGRVGDYKVRVFADDGNGPEMCLVPAGYFKYQNTTPMIFINSFKIDKYEVTNSSYCEFLNNADPTGVRYTTSMEIKRYGTSGNYYYTVQTGKENYPIRYVSAYDAEAYAAWLSSQTGRSYRLPTEQEWEKAAGWNPSAEYLWTYGYQSNSISGSWCNYNNIYGGPLPVGSFNGTGGKNNAYSYYGCYDMSGNVWEWTSSKYDSSSRVLRGGSWNYDASNCAVTYRYSHNPSGRNNYGGFRLVLDLN